MAHPFGLRTTRSGREFSDFAGHTIAAISTGHNFAAAVRRAAERDDAGLGSPIVGDPSTRSPVSSAPSFDVPLCTSPFEPQPPSPGIIPPTSPPLLPPLSPYSTGPPSPALSAVSLDSLPGTDPYYGDSEPESLPPSSAPSSPSSSHRSLSPEAIQGTKKRKRRAGDNAARSQRRIRKKKSLRGLPTDLSAPPNPHQEPPAAIPTELAPETHFPVESTGYRGEHIDTIQIGQVWLVEILLAQGLNIFKWDGITPYAILDNLRRIVGVLAGRPSGKSRKPGEWDGVTAGMERAVDTAQAELWFTDEDLEHRRGEHTAKAFGLSHGGGQTHPRIRQLGTSEAQDAHNQAVLEKFRADKNVQRFAGFANSALQYFSPMMYERYCDYMGRLAAHDPDIKSNWNFGNSVFPCTTINFGPSAVCYDHIDFANAAAGWCSISCAGSFDPTKGGHLVLFDIDQIIEFPPGSTILIPSSVMRHGNTPVQAGEKRVSMTQYAAGGLFRWVDNGFKKQKKGRLSKAKQAEAAGRFESLLGLYSHIDTLASDRARVFGTQHGPA